MVTIPTCQNYFHFGADPEVFIRDKKEGEFIAPSVLGFPGTKINKYRLDSTTECHVDGMALEFNVSPCAAGFFPGRVTESFQTVQNFLSHHNSFDLEAVATPTVEFSQLMWNLVDEDFKRLGCDPDFNAWRNGSINTPPNQNTTFRSGAGHIHIGMGYDFKPDDNDFKILCQFLTRELDACVGVASILWDKDTKRRTLYGKAGAYRPKSYGLEYRVLSNAWLCSKDILEWITATVHERLNALKGNGKSIQHDDVPNIINKNQRGKALSFLKEKGISLPDLKVFDTTEVSV